MNTKPKAITAAIQEKWPETFEMRKTRKNIEMVYTTVDASPKRYAIFKNLLKPCGEPPSLNFFRALPFFTGGPS